MTKVDLFIPTYNRPDYLRRILNYYSLTRVKFNIIVADSSKTSVKKINKKIIALFPKLNILYLDKFPETKISHSKFAEMVKYAKNKYCVFCADDDFINPSGIKEAVKFLEKNPNYSSAHGTYISFYTFKPLVGKKQFWWNFIYPYRSISSSDPIKRLIAHPKDCQQVLWSVRKTEVVKKVYKELLRSEVDPKLFGERLPDVLTVVLGKMKRLDTFYGARQAFSTSYNYWPGERDYIKAGTFNKEFGKFKKTITNNLRKVADISESEASVILDKNMEIYLSSSFQQYWVARFNLVLTNFPPIVIKSLRTLHARYLFFKDKKDRIGEIDNTGSKYFQDFDLIKQLVLSG